MTDQLNKADQTEAENRAANDLPADNVETPAVETPQSERSQEPATEVETEKKDIPRGSKFQSRREEIYAKHRQNREPKDGEEEFAPVPPDREKVFFGKNTETRTDREARRALERGRANGVDPTDDAPVEEPAPTRHKLKVHGREVELTQDEIIAHAQKSLAADGILDDAKRMRDEHKQMLEELRQANQNREQPAKPQQAEELATKPDEAELDKIIDRIQVGDPKEAKEALMQFGDQIRDRLEQRLEERIGNLDERIAATTRMTADAERRREQTMATLEEFATDYPEFKSNKSLQTALAHETAEVMKTHLTEIGVEPDTLSNIQREHKLSEMEAVSWAYRALQDGGFALPDNALLLRTAGDALRKGFTGNRNETPPAPNPGVPADRQERKQNIAPQPRRASAPPTSEMQERSRDDARLSAVRQMKAYRRGGRV